jgi:hypothetical protein
MPTIHTTIDGIPVELEIIKINSTDTAAFEHLNEHLSKEVVIKDGNGGSTSPAIISNDQKIRVATIGSDKIPASAKDISKISNSVSNANITDIIHDISILAQNIESAPKDWWTSKIIWVNIGTIIVSLTTYFGFDLKSHGIDMNTLIAFIPTILGFINILLRKNSSQPLSNKVVPDSIQAAAAKFVQSFSSSKA